MYLIGTNMSRSKKWELSSSSSLAGDISPDSIHVSKKIAIELDETQETANQTVVSDTVSKEHGINAKELTSQEESPEVAKVWLLMIKVNNTKLDTKPTEAKKKSDSLTETISNCSPVHLALLKPTGHLLQKTISWRKIYID